MFGMKHLIFASGQIILSCEKAAGIFIQVNEKEATLTKDNIFKKNISTKKSWHFYAF